MRIDDKFADIYMKMLRKWDVLYLPLCTSQVEYIFRFLFVYDVIDDV